jgi:hypothetical protein
VGNYWISIDLNLPMRFSFAILLALLTYQITNAIFIGFFFIFLFHHNLYKKLPTKNISSHIDFVVPPINKIVIFNNENNRI